MSKNDKIILPTILLCVAAIIVAALLLPGCRLEFLLPASFICGAVVFLSYHACSFRTLTGMIVLLAAYTLVICGIILNIHYFTTLSGGTYAYPVLQNNDAYTDWALAINRMFGEPIGEPDRILGLRYYSYLAQGLMGIFGRDIAVPLMFNALCYGLTLVMIGAVAWNLTRSRRTATAAMCVTALMCYLMVEATILIKDVPLTLCFALAAYIMIDIRRHGYPSARDFLFFVPVLFGAMILRSNLLLMLALGSAIFAFSRKKSALSFAVMTALYLGAYFLFKQYFLVIDPIDNITADLGTEIFKEQDNVRAWNTMLHDPYYLMPFWKKLIWLPASVIVQFLIPFPWNFARDMIFGPTEALAHFGFFWYYAGAILIYWIFACQKKSPKSMRLMVLWGVLLTVLTAYMMAGRVSRYCLVYLPLLLPAVAFAVVNYYHRRSFWVWLGIFTLVLVPVLIICHHLQMSAL